MKTRILAIFSLVATSLSSLGQNMEYVYNQDHVYFYGLDFSHAKMIGEDFDNPHRIVNHYFEEWNALIFREKDKYSIERYFDFKDADYLYTTLTPINRMVNPQELRTNKTHRIDRAKMFESVRGYELEEQSGLGMVIFVESFNEYTDRCKLYYAFFDLATRDMIVLESMEGETGGVGFRNNWANSIHHTMENWQRITYRQIVLDKIPLLSEKQQSKYYEKVRDKYNRSNIDYFIEKVEKRIRKEGGQLWDSNYYKPLPIPSNTQIKYLPLAKTETEQLDERAKVTPVANYVSEVDINIPKGSDPQPYRFALIIGNEDYQSYQPTLSKESNVDYANHDAEIFKLYAEKVLGVPSENIVYLLDAKVVELNRALIKINKAIELSNGKAEVFFYYAGHGFPDQNTKDPYLIPVDVSANDLKYAFKMTDIYKTLTQFESKSITVFLDACFSGGARNKGLMTARSVKIKPKEGYLNGNIVIFSAAGGTETAQPLHKERHGLFTYYLLKKLQETAGHVSYEELYNYLKENVGIKSVFINESEQTPQVSSSPAVGEEWKKWKLN